MTRARFDGKVAVVVGGRGGMGEAVSRQLHAEGAIVHVADISPPPPAEERISHSHVDVTVAESVTTLFDEVRTQSGDPEVVVFLAGAFEARPFLDSEDELFARLYAVNAFGGARIVREAGRRMKARGAGAIVVVASQSARVCRIGQAAYGSSKAALTYLTKVAGLELAPAGVRCNLVLPGVTETPMARAVWASGAGSAEAHIRGDLTRFRAPIPLGRVATPDDVAAAVLFLASDDARHITMTEMLVDGGSSLIA